ncbi:hypothetical protein HID58_073798 [Brassica napus]|uniref:26S proteasome non-ATPase regulatory subunit 2 homolog n=1 Tax=Brassica napus TaxID=3708 RepID=A0ABQ7YF51_BRANA|nr:hypothetical protein HID58_073798 [Brassica napus]
MAPTPDPNSVGGGARKDEASVNVPSKDPKKKDDKKEDDLSEEDLELKQNLELYVERVQDPNPDLQRAALESMRNACPISSLSWPLPCLPRESLSYRLIGTEGDIGSWGHEYVRNLAGEIAQEYTKRQHNAETEAVDLLMDVEDLDLLLEHVDKTNFKRTCNYLTSAAKYLPGPDDMLVLDISYMIYMKFEEYPNALQIALFLDNTQYVKQVFTSCADLLRKKQFCYMIARHGITFELDDEMVADEDDREALQDIVNNTKLSEGYLTLARDIEVMEAKTPEDIYKAHLLDGRASSGASVDSARQNLAATFVNAFVNAGFGQDKLMTVPSDSTTGSSGNWLFKNKEHGKISAAASLGMIQLWDVEAGLAQLDKYFHSNDNPILSGALLGVGIVNSGIKSDCDPALALLGDYVDKEDSSVRIGAIMGLGIAYAGSQNDQIRSKLSPILNDAKAPLDVIAFASLSLGMIYVVRQNWGMPSRVSCPLVQDLLAQCGEHLEKGDIHQGPAVLGLAMVAMSEELGIDMEIRSLERMLQYGEQNIRRAVPLALGLLCISNPKVTVMDTLSRLSHDTDSEVAMAAIISLGLIGAGTNNARLAGMLRNLSSYYYKDASLLFCVRIAQGLVHMGKGLLTLTPFHSERFLLSPTALAGIVTLLHACLDMKPIILGKYHYVLYFLVLAMQPRMMLTVDKDLKPLSVPVRVGQAVDVVGQAGRPKTITGFQTHSTPVLLAAGERAELATDKYIPLSPILEGFIILEENPDYREE